MMYFKMNSKILSVFRINILLLSLILLGITHADSQISILGDATPAADWTTDHDLIQDMNNTSLWTTSIYLKKNFEVKFRANYNWTLSWGGTTFPTGTLDVSESNIMVDSTGTYAVTFDSTALTYTFNLVSANVGIGTTTPEPSALFELNSNDKGLLTPRMPTSQRNAILSPATGLLVYDTDTGSFWYFNNSAWNEISITKPPIKSGDNTTTIPIPDGDLAGIISTITLSDPDTVQAKTRIRVCLDITHPWALDLFISLEAPNGTSIDLSSENGQAFSGNYTNTCFTTEAANSIIEAAAPFTGDWQPEEPFANFIGTSITGDWTLNVGDIASIDEGQLNWWSIAFTRPVAAHFQLSDADGDSRVSVEDFSDEDMIRFQTRGNEAMVIDNAGNIGIGTTLPVWNMDIVGDTPDNGSLIQMSNSDKSQFLRMFSGRLNDQKPFLQWKTGSPFLFQSSNDNQTQYAELMRIGATGNLGIGTTTPINKLDVEGGIAVGSSYSGTSAAPANGAIIQGNVGIGTITPEAKLHIEDAAPGLMLMDSDNLSTAVGSSGIINAYGSDGVGGTSTGRLWYLGSNSFSTSDAIFGNQTPAGKLLFATNGAARMTIDSAGKVGIGTTIPANRLDVEGGIAIGSSYSGTSPAPLNGAIIQGSVGIGTSIPGDYKLVVNHNNGGLVIANSAASPASFWELFQATNTDLVLRIEGGVPRGVFFHGSGVYLSLSDRRLKENIAPLQSILPRLMKLKPSRYHFISDPKKQQQLGFIAQEVEEIFPELVMSPTGDDPEKSPYMMDRAGMAVIAVQAIQEQQEMILEQQALLEKQANKLKHMEMEIANLKLERSKMVVIMERISRLEKKEKSD
jgi:subtilisin-like proprotein convertase family protein